jgi:class 3 adenylate cyclase
VDDERHNLTAFKAAFRRDYTVHVAISAAEGLNLLREKPVDLIITDQRMPDMTGVQFLEKIIPEFPDTVRMILTGFSDIDAIVAAINEGRIFRYITKPWDDRELRLTLQSARQLAQLQQSRRALLAGLTYKVEEQERTLRVFMRYVPQSVVEQALDATEDSMFDGELREVAVLFCDLRGFTSLSETLTPREVVAFLNDYYAIMTTVIKDHGGVVNQYVGDEIFAAFGAPDDILEKERRAVFCAIDMIAALSQLNEKHRERLGQEIQMGIGVNYGEVVAGNLGSEERIDYSLTGDTVNTGKRIESLTKEDPNSIFISESVFQPTQTVVHTERLDPVQVKGKRDKVGVYRVVGRV